MDFPWTEQFLSLVPIDGIPQDERWFFVYDLGNLRTEPARKQLERIAQSDREEAAEARDYYKAALMARAKSDSNDASAAFADGWMSGSSSTENMTWNSSGRSSPNCT
jgi:hypothetical protein